MARLPWHNIETVLLDMDGTLLDLHFDNQFWVHHVPKKLSEKFALPLQECRERMDKEYAKVHGQLQWYCLDYWAQTLDLDIISAKRELMHLIEMRGDCLAFLDALKTSQRDIVLLTNAHPDALSLKLEQTKLDAHIEKRISTHQFGVSKESQSLWKQVHEYLNFNPQTTLFVDDSQRILDAAKEYGIAYTLGVTNPDTKMPENEISGHQTTNDFRHLVQDIIASPYALKVG